MSTRTILIGLAATALLAGCAPWRDGREADGGEPGHREHVAVAARGDRDAAALAVVGGATTVTVRAVDLGADLFRISTPPDSRLAPEVVESGGRFELHLAETGSTGPAAVEVLLDQRVRWDLRLSGGSTETLVDLGAGRLSALDFAAGSSRIEAVLPEPDGAVTVRMGGGANTFLVRVPQAVPVRVSAGGGAATVTVDGVRRSGIAGGTVFTPPGWADAADRYDVDATAGVSTLTVDRR
ncbi:hypothetical protein [Catellatospora bangladeshensis]|uniref:DUF2154 domain-containing protein n=1 Tax=Catellatospora bangladeshensis TaxID=310355 RepID=A0A8J3JH54_9ACTN|nr:hypothetical protein [Catellatospora bangladeshensis]GIF80407.1 hypothetical protein Cba03nite_17560 [Catellatospora bangladeshensis]